jgi:hypothetical protein
MQGANSGPQADVVAVFSDQTAVNDAIYHLRLSGFGEDRIACYSRPPGHGLTDWFNRDYAFVGAGIGGVVGVVLGQLLAPLVNNWSSAQRSIDDSFGLLAAMTIIPALVCGLIGWGIGLGCRRPMVTAPAVDTSTAPFVLAVVAGADRDRVWSIIRDAGGHDPATPAAHH